MVDLEKQAKDLRAKCEEPIRKYVEARNTLHDAIMNSDVDRMLRLCDLRERLYPDEAYFASSRVVTVMDYLDTHDDKFGVFKKSLVDAISKWKQEMESIEV